MSFGLSKKTTCKECGTPLFKVGVGGFDEYFYEDEHLQIEHIPERCSNVLVQQFEKDFGTAIVNDIISIKKDVEVLKQEVEWLRSKTNFER